MLFSRILVLIKFMLIQVCCASNDLDRTLKREIAGFSEALRSHDGGQRSGQISLEFFQKKRSRWLFQPECIPWEVWTVRLDLLALHSEHERQLCREQVGDLLTDKIMCVAEAMNRHEFIPKMPTQAELDLVFDTSYIDVQPYLFKVSKRKINLKLLVILYFINFFFVCPQIGFSTCGPTNPSVSSTMKKLIKETLSL